MTIKGPDAHNYGGGLGDLLGWRRERHQEYDEEDFDVEEYYRQQRRQQRKRQQQQQQQQQHYDPEPAAGFAHALGTPPLPAQFSVATPAAVEETTVGENASSIEQQLAKQAKMEK